MPVSSNRYKFILVILCESFNYLIAEPTKTTQSPEVCKVLMKHFIRYFGTPKQIITDQDPALPIQLMSVVFQSIWNEIDNLQPNQP